jgi:hypothetical protein
MPKKRCPVEKGQYYAVKYKGSGGDLVIGQVQSVRSNGHVVSTNLLNGKTSTKKIDIFLQRNKRVSGNQAKKIISAFKKNGKLAARKAAISAPEFRNSKSKPEQLQLPEVPPMNINKDIRELLEKRGCKIKEESGIWTVKAPDGKTWDLTTPQEKKGQCLTTKYVVWASWETVTNFGTEDADYLSDGEALCLGAFDSIEEAENYIQTLGSEKHLIRGCPGV